MICRSLLLQRAMGFSRRHPAASCPGCLCAANLVANLCKLMHFLQHMILFSFTLIILLFPSDQLELLYLVP